MAEGVIHIITAFISFWGMWANGIWDWRIAASPTFDIFLGLISLITAMVLGKIGHDHS
jgi:hypothetical protein